MLRTINKNLFFSILKSRIVLSAISAILLVLAFPRFNLEYLGWISFVPLFFALERCSNLKERFLTGYIWGLVFFFGILYWLVHVSVPGMIALVLVLSICPAFFCLFRPQDNIPSILTVPCLWVAMEYMRSHLLSGFPWALLGQSQYLNLSLIQIADITGVYGISFMLMSVNFCIYITIKKFRTRFIYTFICFLILMLSFSYSYYRLKQQYITKSVKIAVVQGNIPQEKKWDPRYEKFIVDVYEQLTVMSRKDDPMLVIWPETSFPGFIEENTDMSYRVKALAARIGAYLLVGSVREFSEKLYNSAFLISPEGAITDTYDKIHLVPFGEYIPLEKYMPWFRNLVDKPIGGSEFGSTFKVFRIKTETVARFDDSIVRDVRFLKFGVLVCFEDIFPGIARRFVKDGAEFMVNITNDAWFGNTAAPYQHMQSSVFRAIENRVPVVRAANTGVSCFINQKGQIISYVMDNGKETFIEGYNVSGISPLYQRTVYTMFGDVFVYLCIVLMLVAILIRRKNRAGQLDKI